ncbi:Hrf1 family protein [Cooperia oncophora]
MKLQQDCLVISKYLNTYQSQILFSRDNLMSGRSVGDWSLKYAGSDEPVPAKDDVNAPDLYIPLMAFITYIIVSGFVLGTQGRFSPEMLGILTSNAFIWIIIENIIIFVSKYVMNISQSLSVWHSLAYSTYKFFGMIICLLMFMGGGKTFYYCTLVYTSLALVFSVCFFLVVTASLYKLN